MKSISTNKQALGETAFAKWRQESPFVFAFPIPNDHISGIRYTTDNDGPYRWLSWEVTIQVGSCPTPQFISNWCACYCRVTWSMGPLRHENAIKTVFICQILGEYAQQFPDAIRLSVREINWLITGKNVPESLCFLADTWNQISQQLHPRVCLPFLVSGHFCGMVQILECRVRVWNIS